MTSFLVSCEQCSRDYKYRGSSICPTCTELNKLRAENKELKEALEQLTHTVIELEKCAFNRRQA